MNSIFAKINSWNDLKIVLETKTKQEKGKVFEELTKFYLECNSTYKLRLSKVWLFHEVPPSVLKKLNLPSNDQGIDILAETIEGKYWAIQCKYLQDEDQKLSHRKISTFIALSKGVAKNITHCLVCTTVDDYATLYKGKENIGFITSDTWNSLNKEFFDTLKAKLKGKAIQKKPFKPKPHQVKALKEAKDYFVKGKNQRGKLVFPCGAGKSLTGYWITRELKAKHIIVAVPSLSLVKQTLEVYARESDANKDKIRFLCICSDDNIGKGDDVAIHTQDLGVECVTDKKIIEDWLKENKNNKTIIFTTYQSGKVIAEACKTTNFSFDLGIMDEAHKTVGDKDKLFSHLLFDKNIKIEKRIFMTATERRYAGSSDTILSMDNVDVYGDTFTQMSFKEAIETGILSDYKIITLFISDNEVQKIIEQNAFVKPTGKEWDKETEARTLASLVAIRKAMTDYPIHHAVTFHSSIAKAKAFDDSQELFSKAYPQFTKIESFHVSGAMPTGERSKIVNEFATVENAIITNAKCLTEGVDVPNIDCVLFADSRKSTVDIVQAVGRALRKKQGKDFGYVILPVFTESKNKEEIIESDEFKEILTTIRALASNDERIIEFFRDRSKGKKKGSNEGLIQFEIDENITELINENDLIEKLELTTWSKLAKLSWMPFEEAKKIVRALNLKSWNDFRNFSTSHQKPPDLPTAPAEVYLKNGWTNWGDFLGLDNLRRTNHNYIPYLKAKELVSKLGLKSYKEWARYDKGWKQRNNIPSNADQFYKANGWTTWGDFLGTNKIANYKIKVLSYEEAKKYLKKFKFNTNREYKDFVTKNKPEGLIINVERSYRNKGWISWGDFLGTGKRQKGEKWMDFEELKSYLKKLNISDRKKWSEYCNSAYRLPNIPSNPYSAYKSEWKGFGDFFGTGNVATYNRTYLSFEDAKKEISKLKFKGKDEWKALIKSGKLPPNIPNAPHLKYKNEGWKDWKDFLGYDSKFKTFTEAKEYLRNLKISSWEKFCLEGRRPKDIPNKPNKIYKKDWKGWADFLGKG